MIDWKFGSERSLAEETAFVTMKEGRMQLCTHQIFKKKGDKRSYEISKIITIDKEVCAGIEKILGVCLKDDDLHYVKKEDIDKIKVALMAL